MEAPPRAEAERAAAPGPALSGEEFARLARFIEGHCGIRMPPGKRTMLEARLGSRVRELGLRGFGDYCDRVLAGADPEELARMVDAVTTNKTDFFREPAHFEVLVRDVLPALARQHRAGVVRELRVWSAGCSSGEEPYTLAIVLSEEAERRRGLRFTIVGSDISARVLRHARAAVYPDAQVQPIPLALRRKYLLRSTRDPALVRMGPALRAPVRFRQLNLLDADYGVRPPVDVIFCRNVFIYFERATQAAILARFAESLVPGGFLFLGHSETVNGLRAPFETVAPTVYRRAARLA